MKQGSWLDMWVIYDHPKDFPEGMLARRWIISGGQASPTLESREADTLKKIRRLLPGGMIRMDRHPDDDPVIVEVWM